MEQTASKERAMSSFTKRKGQTTYKVNVFFAENTTSTFEDTIHKKLSQCQAQSRFAGR